MRENPFFLEKERVLSRSFLKKAAWVFLFPWSGARRARRNGESIMEMQRKRAVRPSLRGADGAKQVSFGRGPGETFPFPKGKVPPGVLPRPRILR